MNQQIHTYKYVHVLLFINNMRLNINAHLLAHYISMSIHITPPYAKEYNLRCTNDLTAQNEQDDGHSIPSTKRSRRCRYIILFILRLSTDAFVVPTIKHRTGMGRQEKHVYENLIKSVIHVFAWTDLGKQRNLSVITAKPQAQIWIFPKHQVRVSSVQLRRSVGTWHSYKKKSSHTLVSRTTQFLRTHKYWIPLRENKKRLFQ